MEYSVALSVLADTLYVAHDSNRPFVTDCIMRAISGHPCIVRTQGYTSFATRTREMA